MNRREAIKRIAAIAGGTVVAGSGLDALAAFGGGIETPMTSIWETLAMGDMGMDGEEIREEIEKTFGIRLYNPGIKMAVNDERLVKDLGPRASSILYEVNPWGSVFEWDLHRMILLKGVISRLPKNFYDATRKPLTFVVWGLDEKLDRRREGAKDNFQGVCACSIKVETFDRYGKWRQDFSPPVVAVIKRDMRVLGSEILEGEVRLVHELAHLRLARENIAAEKGVENRLITETLKILGVFDGRAEYWEANRGLVELMEKKNHLKRKNGGELIFNENDRLGVMVLPAEVLPVCCEYYWRGGRSFRRELGSVFGKEKTESLYLFIKQILFSGVEYWN